MVENTVIAVLHVHKRIAVVGQMTVGHHQTGEFEIEIFLFQRVPIKVHRHHRLRLDVEKLLLGVRLAYLTISRISIGLVLVATTYVPRTIFLRCGFGWWRE